MDDFELETRVNDIVKQAEKFQSNHPDSFNLEEINLTKKSKKKGHKWQDTFMNIISDDTRKKILDKYGYRYWMYAVAIFGGIFLYIQFGTIIYNKDSTNVSMPAYIIYLIASISWLIYGFLLKDWILILSGIINTIGNILLIAIIPVYNDAKKSVHSSKNEGPKLPNS